MALLRRLDTAPDLSERVYLSLRDAICDGELAPSARLTQEQLAASLNVSRQPVLQALRLLKRDGFVIDAGRRGLMVAPLDARALAQLYEVRSALDGLAARLAAQRGTKLDTAVIETGRRAAGGGVPAMIDADMKFHDLVYAASGNPLIVETAHKHWHHVRRAMGAVLRSAALGRSVWDEHEAILSAINGGDAERAERLAREHCENAGSSLARQINDHLRVLTSKRSQS